MFSPSISARLQLPTIHPFNFSTTTDIIDRNKGRQSVRNSVKVNVVYLLPGCEATVVYYTGCEVNVEHCYTVCEVNRV